MAKSKAKVSPFYSLRESQPSTINREVKLNALIDTYENDTRTKRNERNSRRNPTVYSDL